MSKISQSIIYNVLVLFVAMLLSCESATSSNQEMEKTSRVDTLYVSSRDTIVVVDSVFLRDTIHSVDTIHSLDTIHSVDTLVLVNKDTITVYDSVYNLIEDGCYLKDVEFGVLVFCDDEYKGAIIYENAVTRGSFIDERDNKIYSTIRMGTQIWMAQNLDYKLDAENEEKTKCDIEDDAVCEMFGSYYTWEEALEACPSGWHLPSKEEFETLILNAGGEEKAGISLKSMVGWKIVEGLPGSEDDTGLCLNTSGFTAYPAGYASGLNQGVSTQFWSSTEAYSTNSYGMSLYTMRDGASIGYMGKDWKVSVRCLKD